MSDLLHVRNLSLQFKTRDGVVNALQDVSLSIGKGETVGLVGESGSGKSVLSYAILGLSDTAARVTQGTAYFDGMDLLAAKEADLQEIRGREVSMIFQNPKVALNPIRKVGHQLEDVLLRHTTVLRSEVKARAIECLAEMKIPDPERRYHAYPFELSGGLCQRVMIALALACGPKLLIADEPTTGLDVTTQAAIMALVKEKTRARGMATLLITHDLGLAREQCDRIVVMHAGHIVESAPTEALFTEPRHPYTRLLIGATPVGRASLEELTAIGGSLPDLRRTDLPTCRFAERCPGRSEACALPLPELVDGNHVVRCHRVEMMV
ncbi:ABC transporter ATP-binding protein [Ramlibacter albus]|uniref:ABC transporter ATP-binding protein n=1 Tax=Ramlibacter albus TaxID=2079448 RepID=A0A923M4G3_9BURK|nr:ABC transporter ATP-binding protein [Ramlibacter albus]MBC5763681.1 ABC transporter ATP-binding protein [Ramlibacter albus]